MVEQRYFTQAALCKATKQVLRILCSSHTHIRLPPLKTQH